MKALKFGYVPKKLWKSRSGVTLSFAKTQSAPPRSDDRSLGLAFHSEEVNLIYVRMEKSAAEVTMTEHARRPGQLCLPNE